MSGILKLPCELLAGVLRQLDHVQYLVPARLTCRSIDEAFVQNPQITHEVLKKQISVKLMPYAIASFECSRASDAASCISFLDLLYDEPTKLESQLSHLTVAEIRKMAARHDLVENLTSRLATDAWTMLDSTTPMRLTDSEKFRFHRAFYRFDMLCGLLRMPPRCSPEPFALGCVKGPLLSRHTPWANEQVGCVHNYLESLVMKDAHEAMAHDVDLGEFTVDYLEGGGLNYWLQEILSRGIEYIDKLVRSTCESQASLLQAGDDAVNGNGSRLYDVLDSEMDEDNENDAGTALKDYPEGSLADLFLQQDPDDSDRGPYEAWWPAHRELTTNAMVMGGGHDALRQRAYVLWDAERLQRHGLLPVFEKLDQQFTPDPDESEREEMQRSWDARSKIWQKGGKGLWYPGDESKIVWR